ncbi:retrovirus-related pol polyprotein from transposon TNT 1-94 [Tanacetum coccineum]
MYVFRDRKDKVLPYGMILSRLFKNLKANMVEHPFDECYKLIPRKMSSLKAKQPKKPPPKRARNVGKSKPPQLTTSSSTELPPSDNGDFPSTKISHRSYSKALKDNPNMSKEQRKTKGMFKNLGRAFEIKEEKITKTTSEATMKDVPVIVLSDEESESDEEFTIRFKRYENRKRLYIPKIPTMALIDDSTDDDVANSNDVKDQFDILLDDEADDDIYKGEELVQKLWTSYAFPSPTSSANYRRFFLLVVREPPYVCILVTIQILQIQKRILVNHMCGGPITGPLAVQPFVDTIDTLVAAWLQGVANVLFGDYGFTRKLARSWFKSVDELPMNIKDLDYDPLYPFGFGLTTTRTKAT